VTPYRDLKHPPSKNRKLEEGRGKELRKEERKTEMGKGLRTPPNDLLK